MHARRHYHSVTSEYADVKIFEDSPVVMCVYGTDDNATNTYHLRAVAAKNGVPRIVITEERDRVEHKFSAHLQRTFRNDYLAMYTGSATNDYGEVIYYEVRLRTDIDDPFAPEGMKALATIRRVIRREGFMGWLLSKRAETICDFSIYNSITH